MIHSAVLHGRALGDEHLHVLDTNDLPLLWLLSELLSAHHLDALCVQSDMGLPMHHSATELHECARDLVLALGDERHDHM